MKRFILLILISTAIYAQNPDIIGVSRTNNNGGQVFLSSINQNTGLLTDLSSSSYSNVTANFSYTVDPVLDIFYYLDQTSIIGVSINDGSLVSNPAISSSNQLSFQNFIYNEITQEIIGLERGGSSISNGQVYLSKIDPSNGVVTTISQSSITNTITLNAGTTIDMANQWFHFVSNDRLFTIDISTGNIVHNPLIDNSIGFFDNIVYNEFDGLIYGLVRNSNPPEIYLGKINPVDGNVTPISQSPIGQSFVLAGATIDPFSGIYYYKDDNNFVGVDIITGTVVSSVSIDYSQSNGSFFDFYYYANEKKSLLSVEDIEREQAFDFYPNPVNDKISITTKFLNSLEVIDVYGRVHKSYENINDGANIDLSTLSSGTYFLKGYFENNSSVKKMVVK
jgi:hypothetical protein